MKRTLMALAALMLVLNLAVATEFPILDKQVEIRQARIAILTKTQEISMQAVIDYMEEVSNGSGHSKLESIKDEFVDQADTLQTLTTHVGVNNALRGLRDVTTDFRVKTRERMTEHHGRPLVLLGNIAIAIADHKDELDDLRGAYWDKRKENELEIFDIRIERGQKILDKLEEHGYNITEAQEKLDEIEAKRDDLEDALDSQNHLEVIAVQVEIFRLSGELIEIVRDTQFDKPTKLRVRHWIAVGERVLERTNTIISELETLGYDVSELEEIHDEAEGHLEDAKAAYEDGDMEAAGEALKAFRDSLRELKDAYRDLVFGEDDEEIEAEVEAISDALEETADEMEASIPA